MHIHHLFLSHFAEFETWKEGKCMNKSLKTIQNKKRYLHHLNSNFDSAICCSGLSHRCQWNRCLIGHGRQRNGNNEGDKTTSDSQWSLLHLDLKKKKNQEFLSIQFPHSSKSSFFVKKFNFDFPRKLSIFLGEKLVKMLWFWTF